MQHSNQQALTKFKRTLKIINTEKTNVKNNFK